jgi:hypothetical protein
LKRLARHATGKGVGECAGCIGQGAIREETQRHIIRAAKLHGKQSGVGFGMLDPRCSQLVNELSVRHKTS